MEDKIHIYNSITRKKEEFEPIINGKVGMYVCGPTVYDEPHIGHARSAYIFDVIRRYLKYRKYEVKFVRNVTDVDDKIIDKAKQEYPDEDLNTAVKKVSQKYLTSYQEAMNKLGIEPPDNEPKATEYIDKMQEFIKILIERGMAYESNGDVYFNIKKADKYGCLSHQSLESMESGARIAPGENKKDPLDFALWKNTKEGEPSWDSEWGKGRPGWHIECSTMSSDILGDEFDIHGGGLDLIFPHHENEIAQSRGAGKNFARYWIHHGLLTINGQKMSKSLGNFITVKDFLDKHANLDLLKLLFLSVHYAHPLDYTKERIEEAKKQKKSFDDFFELKYLLPTQNSKKTSEQINDNDKNKIDIFVEKFKSAMDNDFNMPQALSYLFELRDFAFGLYNLTSFDYARSEMANLFNIFCLEVKPQLVLSQELLEKEYQRQLKRSLKDFSGADFIRKEIEGLGFIVEDRQGVSACRRKI